MSPPTPASAASVTAARKDDGSCCTTPGIEAMGTGASQPLPDEQRQDQAGGIDGGLAHEPAQRRRAAQPTRALGDGRSRAHAGTSTSGRAARRRSPARPARCRRWTPAVSREPRRRPRCRAAGRRGPWSARRRRPACAPGAGQPARDTARAADGERSTTASNSPARRPGAAAGGVGDRRSSRRPLGRRRSQPRDVEREREQRVPDGAARQDGHGRCDEPEQRRGGPRPCARGRAPARRGRRGRGAPAPTSARRRRTARPASWARTMPRADVVGAEQGDERPDARRRGEDQPRRGVAAALEQRRARLRASGSEQAATSMNGSAVTSRPRATRMLGRRRPACRRRARAGPSRRRRRPRAEPSASSRRAAVETPSACAVRMPSRPGPDDDRRAKHDAADPSGRLMSVSRCRRPPRTVATAPTAVLSVGSMAASTARSATAASRVAGSLEGMQPQPGRVVRRAALDGQCALGGGGHEVGDGRPGSGRGWRSRAGSARPRRG